MKSMDRTGSFIPTQAKNKPTSGFKTKRIYIFSYISYVLFFSTLLAVVGLFVYEVQLKNKLESKQADLAVERESFNQGDLVRIRDIELRIGVADRILNRHAAVSLLIDNLNKTTLQNIQLEGLSVERTVDDKYVLLAEGKTDSFDALLLQDQILSSANTHTSYSISEVTYGSDSESESSESTLPITFKLEKVIPTSLIPYTGKTIVGAAANVGADGTGTIDGSGVSPSVELGTDPLSGTSTGEIQ